MTYSKRPFPLPPMGFKAHDSEVIDPSAHEQTMQHAALHLFYCMFKFTV